MKEDYGSYKTVQEQLDIVRRIEKRNENKS